MITVCDGWGLLKHKRIVLKEEPSPECPTSHGICEHCQLLMGAELDGKTAEELQLYADYLTTLLPEGLQC